MFEVRKFTILNQTVTCLFLINVIVIYSWSYLWLDKSVLPK